MIKNLLVVALILTSKLLHGQLTVGGFESNYICKGVNNLIGISGLENCMNLQAVVSGHLDSIPIDSCVFNLYPLTGDTTYVSIFKGGVLKHKDTLYAREIQAKSYALIDNELYSGGTISSDKLKDLVGIRLKYDCPWVHQTIKSFSIILIGESQNPIVIRNQGENLSASFKAELLNFINPKTLYIEDIQVIPKAHQYAPSPIVLNIK